MGWSELSYRVGLITEELKAVRAWQAAWERRSRWAILVALAAIAAAFNHSPRMFGEALGGFLRSLLTGG